jgi:integrase
MVGVFIKHLGGDRDATVVSPRDVSAFADHLRHEVGLSAKTVNGKYLSALGTLYRTGKRKHLLSVNPADGVRVRSEKPCQLRSKGFTEGEAKALLTGARGAKNPAHRWLPWLAAYTGARIGELSQLRREDFREEYGIAFVRLSPEAGSG